MLLSTLASPSRVRLYWEPTDTLALGYSGRSGLATLGQLLTLGVGFTILCNLIVLPALIPLRPRRPALVKSGTDRAA